MSNLVLQLPQALICLIPVHQSVWLSPIPSSLLILNPSFPFYVTWYLSSLLCDLRTSGLSSSNLFLNRHQMILLECIFIHVCPVKGNINSVLLLNSPCLLQPPASRFIRHVIATSNELVFLNLVIPWLHYVA